MRCESETLYAASFFPFSSVIRSRVAAHFSVTPGPMSIVIDFDSYTWIDYQLPPDLHKVFHCRKLFIDFNIIAHHREELEDFAQRFKLKKMGEKNFYDHSLAVFVLKIPL